MLVTLTGASLPAPIEFHGDADAGAYTYSVEEDGLKGWLDGLETRRESIARTDAHGEFDVPGFLTARSPSLTGAIKATSAAGLQDAIDALISALADGSAGVLAVDMAGRSLSASVRRDGKPDIKMLNPKRAAKFRMQWWAADPRRYGAPHSFGPSSSVPGISHDGNFPALSQLIVEGSSGGGYTVTGPGGKQIIVTQPLVGGSPHTLDLATGGLYIGGVRIQGGRSVYQPWSVPVGSTITVAVSAGTVTVQLRDTFI